MLNVDIKINGNRLDIHAPVVTLNRDLLKGLLYVVGWGYAVRVFVNINGTEWNIMPKRHELSYRINNGEAQSSPMYPNNMDLSIDVLCELIMDHLNKPN